MELVPEEQSSWLDRPLRAPDEAGFTTASASRLNWEIVIYSVLLVLAIASRFYLLEPRVMSHDETSHVYFSWKLYHGEGFQHDPMMHGPLQFHLVALSFLLFGDNDFTARIPAALFSIATVMFMWNYRRYLGRVGALAAAVMFLISPYMLYYGRYVRNEAFVALFGVMTIWATLRYFETGQKRYLLWLTGAIVLHFTAKETSYIYTAQLLLFLGLYFFLRLWRRKWPNEEARIPFVIALGSGLVFGAAAFLSRLFGAAPAKNLQEGAKSASGTAPQTGLLVLILFATVALLVSVYYLIAGHHRPHLTPIQKQYLILALAGIPVALGIALAIGYFLLRDSTLTAQLVNYATKISLAERAGAIPNILIVVVAALVPAVPLLYFGYLLGQALGRVWPFGRERSFDLLMLVGTLILPALSAFFIKLYADPNAADLTNVTLMTVILLPMLALSAGLGTGWSQRLWLTNAGLYYGIFTVLYTTFFTNIAGFFTGIVGSLGYWMAQQGVQRGSQPWYYYALLQIPMYEFLPALGCMLAAGILIYRLVRGDWRTPGEVAQVEEPQRSKGTRRADPAVQTSPQPALQHPPALRLIAFWVISSLVAFSYAGEKMPWLTVHIVLPMILLAGWAVGRLIETTDWAEFRTYRGWAVVALLPLFVTSMAGFINGFADLVSIMRGLESTATNLDVWTLIGHVLIALLAVLGSVWGIIYLLKDWLPEQFLRLLGVLAFLVMGVLTARAAMMASYQNYDRATEYLVFAHCGPGPKLALEQIEKLSERLTGGTGIQVAYDDKTTYPFWWYLRDYANFRFYGDVPNRDLRDVPLILVGDTNYGKIESIVRDDYYSFEYVRMWWPNQDYMVYKWTPKRIWDTLRDTRKRQAIIDIWLNRDYTRYGEVFQRDMYLPNWDPSERFRLYIRKDIATQLWSYSTNPQATTGPYEGKQASLTADRVIGEPGAEEGQFVAPRGIAIAPDGSLYVVDTGNARIQHLSPQGEVLHVWGSFYNGEGSAPPGQFKEPWDVAVSEDGSVYVADTWNHRIQKFTADGQFLTMWGYGIGQDPNDLLGFYGPRGIAVNPSGEVFITDTGNKRIIYYDPDGKPLGQFGEGGMEPGQLDEPVGLTFDPDGNLYVADTWNQRVQVFSRDDSDAYTYVSEWDVQGWDAITPTNYPYIAVDANRHVFVTDPDNGRVIEFTATGEVVRYWEDGGANAGSLNLPVGIAVDPQGGVWVVDSGNGRLLHFTLP
jgi:DNA-binding beta-propeller fold protein YncE/4-amino-4-deoxy-L-arabinose transferase-like glycosyltransferase